MRAILIAVPLALLAACSGGGADNIAADNAANAVAPDAADNASASAANASTSAANDMAAAYPTRAADIQECIEDVRPEVAEGTDLNGFCACAADRMHASGAGERDAMDSCAAEMGIRPKQ